MKSQRRVLGGRVWRIRGGDDGSGIVSKRVFNGLDTDVVNFFRVLADPVQSQELYRRLRRLPMFWQILDELTREYVAARKLLEAMDPVVRAASLF